MGVAAYLNTILVPLSLFITLGYHAHLCYTVKTKPSRTTYGLDRSNRTAWCLNLNQGDDKKAMLVVQTLRNTLMGTIFIATITILVNMALAALTSNAHNASNLFSGGIFGSKSDKILILKFGSASICLLISFLCSSMAIGFLIDATFLMNSDGDLLSEGHTHGVLEKGFTLAFIGNRVFCVAIPFMLWMLGPLLLFLASMALILLLHELDFVPKFPHSHKQGIIVK